MSEELTFQLFRVCKSDGSRSICKDIRAAVDRIAGHLGVKAEDVYERLHSDRRIETNFSIYEYEVN